MEFMASSAFLLYILFAQTNTHTYTRAYRLPAVCCLQEGRILGWLGAIGWRERERERKSKESRRRMTIMERRKASFCTLLRRCGVVAAIKVYFDWRYDEKKKTKTFYPPRPSALHFTSIDRNQIGHYLLLLVALQAAERKRVPPVHDSFFSHIFNSVALQLRLM